MIVEMAHVMILGPRKILPEVIRSLQARGVLQIRSLPTRLGAVRVRRIPIGEEQMAAERLMEETGRRLHDLLLLLPAPEEVTPGGGLPDVASAGFSARLEAVESEARTLTDRRLALEEERDLIARYERLLMALVPLRAELPGVEDAETFGLLVKRDRPEVLTLLEQEVSWLTRGVYHLVFRVVDREQMAVLLTVPREFAQDLSQLLFERAISEIKLPDRYAGQPFVKTLSLLLRRSRELPREIQEAGAELRGLSRQWYAPLGEALRAAQDRLARLRAISRCGETEHAFIISGWVPAERYGKLSAALEATFPGKVALMGIAIREAEYGEVPVILRNPPLVRSFELLLAFLPLPRYGSIDPTPFLAAFFPLFFGVMLGDVGFGGVALALALVARARGWGGETGRKLTTIALACSASAIVFGLLFGELFGELGTVIGLRPLLLRRRDAALSFLGLALVLGAVHVVLGIGLALWAALRHGRGREALAKSATLALILVAVMLSLVHLGYLPPALGRAALLALGPLLVVSIALEGFMAPLNLVISIGNILSYARLMALGIASVVLADVANLMVSFFKPAAVGVTAAILLHAVNFSMGLFSPAIQALRLHYVEFFDKFYEAGGSPYEPLTLAA